MDKCPVCQSPIKLSGRVACWCNKDYCHGQRCGADKLSAHYECTDELCKASGVPLDTQEYKEKYA